MTSVRHKRALVSLSLLWLAVLAVFYTFPALDTGFSRLFFTRTDCGDASDTNAVCGFFAAGRQDILQSVRFALFYLPAAVLIALIVWLIHSRVHDASEAAKARRHNVLLLLGAWFLDVIVIVNLLFKAYSGRPRPGDTTLFSGSFDFRAAGDFSGTCTSNCSFISGEAASAGWLLCLLAVLSPRWRRRLALPVLIAATVTPFLRIAFGRHFLSDAVLGFVSAPVVFLFLIAIFGWQKAEDR